MKPPAMSINDMGSEKGKTFPMAGVCVNYIQFLFSPLYSKTFL